MIIARTPFRLSFMGGGSDIPSFYQNHGGAVLTTALNKYMHITVNDRFDGTFRLSYSRTEICDSVDKIEHPIFRTVLNKYSQKGRGLEVISMADIPAGTGLGSSSSFTVALLHALKGHLGIHQSASDLASEASRIEIEDLREPIGKQDQYAAAFGGLSHIRFLPSGEVAVEPVVCQDRVRKELEASTMMFYTGMTRSASKILEEQTASLSAGHKHDGLREMMGLVTRMKTILEDARPLSQFGEILNEGWKIKKTMASGVSNSQIDGWYDRAMKAGAWGGKILGAGGGGFLMVMAPLEKQEAIRKELSELRQIPVGFEPFGSRIIFVG